MSRQSLVSLALVRIVNSDTRATQVPRYLPQTRRCDVYHRRDACLAKKRLDFSRFAINSDSPQASTQSKGN